MEEARELAAVSRQNAKNESTWSKQSASHNNMNKLDFLRYNLEVEMEEALIAALRLEEDLLASDRLEAEQSRFFYRAKEIDSQTFADQKDMDKSFAQFTAANRMSDQETRKTVDLGGGYGSLAFLVAEKRAKFSVESFFSKIKICVGFANKIKDHAPLKQKQILVGFIEDFVSACEIRNFQQHAPEYISGKGQNKDDFFTRVGSAIISAFDISAKERLNKSDEEVLVHTVGGRVILEDEIDRIRDFFGSFYREEIFVYEPAPWTFK